MKLANSWSAPDATANPNLNNPVILSEAKDLNHRVLAPTLRQAS
jgi:hypothetical protein